MKHSAPAIVQIITKLELGGAQKVCLEIIQGLKQHAIPHYLISGTHGPLVDTVKTWDNVYLLPELQREIAWNVFSELRAFWKLYRTLRMLRTRHPNLIVHTHSTKAGIMGRWAAWLARVPHRVHTVHGYGFHEHQSWIPWLIHYIFELSCSFITTRYICVSSHDIQTGIRLFPRFAHKYSLIRAAVDTQHFFIPARTASHSSTHYTFGTVACFKPQKNMFDLLRAFKHVYDKKPHVRLELIGDGILRPDIEQWINDHNLKDAITLHGWQSDVAPFLQRWDAFVLTSLWEGLPCAIVEARLCKLPVISYNTGGIKDIIFDNHNGLLYQQKQWTDLAHGMYTIATNPEIAHTLRSYDDNLSDFRVERMIEQHIQLYKTL